MNTPHPIASRTRTLPVLAGLAMLLLTSTAAAQQAAPPSPYRNPSRMRAGIIMTSIGSAVLIAGSIGWAYYAANEARGPGGCGETKCGTFPAILVGAPTLIVGVPLLAVGIPFWASGARPPVATAGIPAWVPALAPGPGGPRSAALRWTF